MIVQPVNTVEQVVAGIYQWTHSFGHWGLALSAPPLASTFSDPNRVR